MPPIVAALIAEDARSEPIRASTSPRAGPCGREDRAVAEHLAGRFDHHAAAGQEPLSARHGAQPGGWCNAKLVTSKLKEWITASNTTIPGGDRRHVLNTVEYGSAPTASGRGPRLTSSTRASRAERAEAAVLVGVNARPVRRCNYDNALARATSSFRAWAPGPLRASSAIRSARFPSSSLRPVSHNEGTATTSARCCVL